MPESKQAFKQSCRPDATPLHGTRHPTAMTVLSTTNVLYSNISDLKSGCVDCSTEKEGVKNKAKSTDDQSNQVSLDIRKRSNVY